LRTYTDLRKTTNACKKAIERYCRSERIDVAIGVCAPLYTVEALVSAKIQSSRKLIYMLDPITNNHNLSSGKQNTVALEEFVIGASDWAYVTPMIRKRYDGNLLQNKMTAVEFPCVTKRQKINGECLVSFDKTTLNFVFTGYLYPEIRNPEVTLDVLCFLNQHIPICVYFVGGGCEELLTRYKTILGDRLVQISHVSAEASFVMMQEADVLLNIGNNTVEQFPSKVLDYISTGKPILNIVKLPDCPTILKLQRYPNQITLLETDWHIHEETLIQFCMSCRDNIVPFDEIQKLYESETPEYVANQFLNIMQNLYMKEKTNQ
jgi:hypothetical protein